MILGLFFYAPFLLFLQLQAQPQKSIQLGFSGSLSGHFGTYGMMITRGIQAAFNAHPCTVNKKKQQIQLVCMDDRGDAAITKKNILQMKQQGITTFFGVMGTRGALAILPELKKNELALLFPWGTHKTLQDPGLTSVVNALGLMPPQIQHLAETIVKEKQLSRIAIFHADDDFSTEAATHCVEALKVLGQTPMAITSYNRYTFDLGNATKTLYKEDPRVIICISASMPAVKIINYLFSKGHYGTLFYGIDSTFLVPKILASKGIRHSFTSAVPDPIDAKIPLAQQYLHDLKKYFPSEPPSVLSFAYYICARLIVKAINEGNASDKNTIINGLTSMRNYDLHGFHVDFNKQNRYLFGSKTWLIAQ